MVLFGIYIRLVGVTCPLAVMFYSALGEARIVGRRYGGLSQSVQSVELSRGTNGGESRIPLGPNVRGGNGSG